MNGVTPELAAIATIAATILEERIGLKPDLAFRPRLVRALRDVAAERRLDEAQLIQTIGGGGEILDDLVDRITVQETAFFRHPAHFAGVLDTLLPRISGPVRMWSAACANGQEPYSLAMILREQRRAGTVLATDVSPDAVRRTTHGVYDSRELRGVSPERRRQHFVPEHDDRSWRVQQPLRDMVRARRHNLLGPIPDEVANCQIVLCRNVLIYFTAAHAAQFLDRLATVMQPGASLVIGSAETIWHIDDRFTPVQIGSSYVYQVRPRERHTAPSLREVPAPARAAPVPRVGRIMRAAAPAADPPAPDRSSLPAGSEPASRIVEFRRWACSEPDDPLAHFHLGTALADFGDAPAARRAFRCSLAALDRCRPALTGQALEGYDVDELRRLLVSRCGPGSGEVGGCSFEPRETST